MILNQYFHILTLLILYLLREYFTVKSPKPLKNRDFVLQRSWLDMGDQFYIVNHSVNHKVTVLELL